jgi:hypothetical protein
MATAILTRERLLSLVTYDPATGRFMRLVDTYRKGALAGTNPGRVHANGYLYVSLDGYRYLAHRLAWLYVRGEWPAEQIDHINCDRTDNRIANLRAVSPRVNSENRRSAQSQNLVGLRGVSWHDHCKKWRARIMVRGVEHRLGQFDTAEDAHAAYLAAKRRLHEGCTI